MVTKGVKEFYKQDIEYNKLFKKKKKISFDVNEELLQLIDELVKLTKNSRNVIINALLSEGVSPFLKTLETIWTSYLIDEKYEKIRKGMEKILKDLKKIKKSHSIK